MYPLKDLQYVPCSPLFKKSDYREGTVVVWIDNEDVYEGVIDKLHENSATVKDIKKLMPIDYTVRLHYWKIPEGRKAYEDDISPEYLNSISDDLK